MKIAPIPKNDKERLDALEKYKVLDTLPQKDFDDLTLLASYICETPIALISFIDKSRQWFKSKVGLEVSEISRDLAFCAHAILEEDILVVPDSFMDDRFLDNPLVTGGPVFRFYAGVPLVTPSGHKIGTLSVIDSIPREISAGQLTALRALARQVVGQLELRHRFSDHIKLEKELLAEKKIAEDALLAESKFLANISHEIRTPMNAIIGMADLLAETPLNAEQSKYVEIFRRSGDSMLALVNDILDMSKIEANQLRLENINFNLKNITEDTIALLSAKAYEKKIVVSLDFSKDVNEFYMGDPYRIRQIISNLLSNAIKFTDNGIIKVSVETNKSYSPGNILISVTDTGIGIPEEKFNKIFQSFSQLDSSTTRKYGGTGLGLSICKQLVEKMGGEINVSSQVGKGSRFFFTLNLKNGHISDDIKKDGTAVFPDQSNKGNNNELRVLLVDDSDDNRLLIKAYLKNTNYKIDEAVNGQEAVDKIKTSDYDVILMDMQMPVMDGLQATVFIRSWEKEKKHEPVYIIALTAYAFKDEEEKCLAAGCNQYLVKPIKKQMLLDTLKSINNGPGESFDEMNLKHR